MAKDRALPHLEVRVLIDGATSLLAAAGIASPGHDARALAAHALGVDRLQLLSGIEMDADTARIYAGLVERRRLREPLQHIVGSASFRYLRLHVEPGVFVPRPETEVVAQAAVDEALLVSGEGRSPVVVDLCCGAGGIAISVATEVPASQVSATDISLAAVALTRRNARDAGVGAMRVEQADVRDPDTLADLDGQVDVVVSNPPYIPPDAVPVDPEVRDHDPDLALYGGGADGLDIPRAVTLAAVRLLRPGGLYVMEHAEVQAEAARAMVTEAGMVNASTIKDLTGRPRAVLARR